MDIIESTAAMSATGSGNQELHRPPCPGEAQKVGIEKHAQEVP